MERLLAIWIEAFEDEAPDGSTLRDHLALLEALTILCPFTESIRLGLFVLPIRGPSRFFGGEAKLLRSSKSRDGRGDKQQNDPTQAPQQHRTILRKMGEC